MQFETFQQQTQTQREQAQTMVITLSIALGSFQPFFKTCFMRKIIADIQTGQNG